MLDIHLTPLCNFLVSSCFTRLYTLIYVWVYRAFVVCVCACVIVKTYYVYMTGAKERIQSIVIVSV